MRTELKEGMLFVSLPKTEKPRAMILEVKVEELSSRFRRQRPFAPWTRSARTAGAARDRLGISSPGNRSVLALLASQAGRSVLPSGFVRVHGGMRFSLDVRECSSSRPMHRYNISLFSEDRPPLTTAVLLSRQSGRGGHPATWRVGYRHRFFSSRYAPLK